MNDTSAPGVAIVAGASRGLGLIVATDLASRGYAVAISSRKADAIGDAAELIRERTGGTIRPSAVDARDADAVERWVTEVEQDLGPIDVAIHVAGVIQVGPAEAVTRQHFQDAIDTMLWGPINLALAVLPGMRERRSGHVGVVTSIGGKVSPPRLLPYSTAKFGAVGFTEGLAAELSGTGVTATTLVPGLMRTGSHGKAEFFGDASAQYAWFGPAASLPVISMDAERAAKQMVDGVLAGRRVVHVSWLSKVATRVHGVAPGLTVAMMGLGSRLLPKGSETDTVEGDAARQRLRPGGLVDRLTTLGDRAAERFNERRP